MNKIWKIQHPTDMSSFAKNLTKNQTQKIVQTVASNGIEAFYSFIILLLSSFWTYGHRLELFAFWSDETGMKIFCKKHSRWVWYETGNGYLEYLLTLIVKNSEGLVMMWTSLSSKCIGKLNCMVSAAKKSENIPKYGHSYR